MVSTWDFGSYNSGSNPDAAVRGIKMIEKALLLRLMADYIDENGIKSLMKLVLRAIEDSKGGA